jgi:hypothetical protein
MTEIENNNIPKDRSLPHNRLLNYKCGIKGCIWQRPSTLEFWEALREYHKHVRIHLDSADIESGTAGLRFSNAVGLLRIYSPYEHYVQPLPEIPFDIIKGHLWESITPIERRRKKGEDNF